MLRSRKYGSSHHNVQTLEVSKADISKDGKILKQKIPKIQPIWVMEIHFNLKSEKGESVEGLIQNTIRRLGESSIL